MIFHTRSQQAFLIADPLTTIDFWPTSKRNETGKNFFLYWGWVQTLTYAHYQKLFFEVCVINTANKSRWDRIPMKRY